MRRKSFYASELKLEFDQIKDDLQEFIEENQPSKDLKEASGFLNYSDLNTHIYFEFYKRKMIDKYDPGRNESYTIPKITQIPIGVVKDPLMILVFTGFRKVKDHIMEKLPIDKEKRYSLEFSSDFIELLNQIDTKHRWFKEILDEDIYPRGRSGGESRTHKIQEEFSDIDERTTEFKRGGEKVKFSFTGSTTVNVSLENMVVTLTVFPGGRASVKLPTKTDLKLAIPYIAKALKKLLERQERYFYLKNKENI